MHRLIPFISCSARMPVYALIAGVFFPDQKWLVISSLYFLGIAIALISVGIRNKMSGQKDKINFVMEMPPYRFPDMAYVFHHLWIRVWDFLSRVGSVILLASVVMWLLSNLTIDFHFTGVADESLLAHVGQNIAFVFSPLGFGYWEIAVALLSGLMAKEAIISSLGVLLSYGNAGVDASLLAMISPAAAYALLVFVLLYPPCIAAFAAMRNESNSWSFAVKICLHQLAIAWLSSFVIFRIIQFLF